MENDNDLTMLVIPTKRKPSVLCVLLIVLNCYSSISFLLLFVSFEVMTNEQSWLVLILGIPIFLGLLLSPILLILSILYALIRIKNFPISAIPIASFVFLSLLLFIFASVASYISSAKTEVMLKGDGIAVINMIKTRELIPEEYGRVYLPTEYQHLSNLDYAIVGYTDDGSLCVAFDCTVGILVERRAYLYSEEVIYAGEYITNLYELGSVTSVGTYWYLVSEIG